jgi:hypothetical protein
MKEIKKQQWSRLCGDINKERQFARTEVKHVDSDGTETMAHCPAPLLGISLERQRGKISGFVIRLGEVRNGSPAAHSVSIGAPAKVLHATSAETESETIEIHNVDGHKLVMCIFSRTIRESYDSLVEEMAYNLAEVRGFVPGHEQEDWFMAEKLVRKAASLQTGRILKKAVLEE